MWIKPGPGTYHVPITDSPTNGVFGESLKITYKNTGTIEFFEVQSRSNFIFKSSQRHEFWSYVILEIYFKVGPGIQPIQDLIFYRSRNNEEAIDSGTQPLIPDKNNTALTECLKLQDYLDTNQNWFPPGYQNDANRDFNMVSSPVCGYSDVKWIEYSVHKTRAQSLDIYLMMSYGSRRSLRELRFSFIDSKITYDILTHNSTVAFNNSNITEYGTHFSNFEDQDVKYKLEYSSLNNTNSMARVQTWVVYAKPIIDTLYEFKFNSFSENPDQELSKVIISVDGTKNSGQDWTLIGAVNEDGTNQKNLFSKAGTLMVKIVIRSSINPNSVFENEVSVLKPYRFTFSIDITAIEAERESETTTIINKADIFKKTLKNKISNNIIIDNFYFGSKVDTFHSQIQDWTAWIYVFQINYDSGGLLNELLSQPVGSNVDVWIDGIATVKTYVDYSESKFKDLSLQKDLICATPNYYLKDPGSLQCSSCIGSFSQCRICIDDMNCLFYTNPDIYYRNRKPENRIKVDKQSRCPHDDGWIFKADGYKYSCDQCPKNCRQCYTGNKYCSTCSEFADHHENSEEQCQCRVKNCDVCENRHCNICKQGYVLHIEAMFSTFQGHSVMNESLNVYTCRSSTICEPYFFHHEMTTNVFFIDEQIKYGNFCHSVKCMIGYYESPPGSCKRCSDNKAGQCPNDVANPTNIINTTGKKYYLKSDGVVLILDTNVNDINLKNCIEVSGFGECLKCESSDFFLTLFDKWSEGCDCRIGFSRDITSNLLKCEACISECKKLIFDFNQAIFVKLALNLINVLLVSMN